MDNTPNLELPYIMAGQAQKHITHNEAIRALDALVQIVVINKDLTSPPGSPTNGDRYIPAIGATGAWVGKDGQIAAFQDNAWIFYPPNEGWLAWVADEDKFIAWDGITWNEVLGGGSVNPTPLVGVNSSADSTNRLSISSPASLFNHEGAGHQQKINKNTVSDSASQLYQTGFSGRAEIGLIGDDDFRFKVSSDGSTFKTALTLENTTGCPRLPSFTVASVPSAASAGAGAIIFISNETGGAVLAFSDGSNWRRATDRNIII